MPSPGLRVLPSAGTRGRLELGQGIGRRVCPDAKRPRREARGEARGAVLAISGGERTLGARLRRHLPSGQVPVPRKMRAGLFLATTILGGPPTVFLRALLVRTLGGGGCFKCCFVLNLLLKITKHQLYS